MNFNKMLALQCDCGKIQSHSPLHDDCHMIDDCQLSPLFSPLIKAQETLGTLVALNPSPDSSNPIL